MFKLCVINNVHHSYDSDYPEITSCGIDNKNSNKEYSYLDGCKVKPLLPHCRKCWEHDNLQRLNVGK